MKNFMKKNQSFLFFCFLVLLIMLVAVFAPLLSKGQDPTEGILANALQKPSGEHWFGTDKLGRDIFARVIYGTRTSLTAALSVVVIIFVIGTFLGILAGYFGGIVDMVIMRFSDMMVSFPGMVLNEGRAYMSSAPWLMLFPGLAIFLVVVVFNLFGDSLRDVLDPRDE